MQRDFGRKPIWLTEFGYQTNPPDYFGVKPSTQAQYVGEAALRAYQLPSVTVLIQFLVRDEPQLDRFQSGLFNVHGVAKPSYSAFRFPLAQVTRRGRARRCGPGPAGKGARTYRLQVGRANGGWRWRSAASGTRTAPGSSPRP